MLHCSCCYRATLTRALRARADRTKVPPIWWTGKAQISEKGLQTCHQPIASTTRSSVRTRSTFCSVADVRSSEEIGPLVTASNAIATATTNLNTATAKAQKAHGAIERSATTLPWVISAVTCALVAVAASAIIIQSDRVSIRREFSEQFKSLPEVYRALARQGRTLQIIDADDGSQQIVLSGKAESAFVVNDRAVMQFR